jgi:hypothetical protein
MSIRPNYCRYLLAFFLGRRGQRQRRCTVALEAVADGLLVSAQPPLAPLAATLCQLSVQLFPTAGARNRNHEVAPRVADNALRLTLIVAPGWASELIAEQLVALRLGEGSGPLPVFGAQGGDYTLLECISRQANRKLLEFGKESTTHDEVIRRMQLEQEKLAGLQ